MKFSHYLQHILRMWYHVHEQQSLQAMISVIFKHGMSSSFSFPSLCPFSLCSVEMYSLTSSTGECTVRTIIKTFFNYCQVPYYGVIRKLLNCAVHTMNTGVMNNVSWLCLCLPALLLKPLQFLLLRDYITFSIRFSWKMRTCTSSFHQTVASPGMSILYSIKET
jgi:hypothetical protein